MSADHRKILKSLEKSGIKFGLEAISGLMEALGNPQNSYRTVLIAGTNGKGSTAAMLSSILSAAGLKVGLYTSPHLSEFSERIRVNGVAASRSELDSLAGKVRESVKEPVTYFEFATALAFLHFSMKSVDIAVLEAGMGGRLDATNLVTPELCVITNISLEHREYLGKDLRQIAREKAGIIKKNGICITGAYQPAALSIIKEACAQRGSRLHVLRRDMRVRALGGGLMNYRGLRWDLRSLKVPLLGRHQLDNAALALAAVEVLAEKGVQVTEEQARSGLELTTWDGRLEVLQEVPLVVVDGAHNPAGVSALLRALPGNFKYKKLFFIFGVLKDKDHRAMLRNIARLADTIILTKPRSERAALPERLREVQGEALIEEDPARALESALKAAGPGDLVCAAGSLYLVAEIREIVQRKN